MDGIKIDVTGNTVRVIEKPSRITAGTIGIPVELTFDSEWDGLIKKAVIRAGREVRIINKPEEAFVLPWGITRTPNVWVSIGVYGWKPNYSVAIPTIWANVCVIAPGTNLDCSPDTDPSLPVWQTILSEIADINERIYQLDIKPIGQPPIVTEISLFASAWAGGDGLYSQIVNISGITPYSKVDLLPTVEQLAIFHNKDLAFVTENEDGVVTVYAIGDKPTSDYTMQVQITEVAI